MKDPKREYKRSPQTRAKMRKAHLGKKHSPETIEKIRAAKKERDTLVAMGLLKPFKHSDATKAKLRKIALKNIKRIHKLTKADRAKGWATKRSISTEKKFKAKLAKHDWDV